MSNISNIYVKTEEISCSYPGTLHEPRMEIKEEKNEDENCDIEIKDEPLDICVHAGSMNENVFCNCKTRIPEYYTKNENIANSHINRIQNGQGKSKNTSQIKVFSNSKKPMRQLISYNTNISDKYLYDNAQLDLVVPKASTTDTKMMYGTSSLDLLKENFSSNAPNTLSTVYTSHGLNIQPNLQLHLGQLQKPRLQTVVKFQLPQGQSLVLTKSTPILQPLQGLNSTKPTLQLHQGQAVIQRQILKPPLQLPRGQLKQSNNFNNAHKTQSSSQVSQVINTKSTMQSQHGQVVLPPPTLKQRQVVLQEPTLQPSLQLSEVDLPQEPTTQSLMQLPKDQLLVLPKGGNLFILDEETNTQKIVQLQPGPVILPPYKPNTKLTIAAPRTIFFPTQNSQSIPKVPEEQLLIQQPQSTLAPLYNKTQIQQPQVLRDAKRALENTHGRNQINPKKINNTGCSTFEKLIPKKKTILEIQNLLKSTETVAGETYTNDQLIVKCEVELKLKQINKYSGNITTNDTEPELKKDTETLPVYFNRDDYTNDILYGKNSLISSKKDLNNDDLIRGAKMLDQHIPYYNNEIGKYITDQELYQHMKSKYNILKVHHVAGKYRFSSYHQFSRS